MSCWAIFCWANFVGRKQKSPWSVGRAIIIAEEEMQKAGVSDWVAAVRQQVWRLAGHIARRTDGRWSTAMLDWTPEGGGRSDGRPLKRWHEDIVRFFWAIGHEDQEAWRIAAACRKK